MKTLKVIKIGGNIVNDELALQQFLDDFSKVPSPKILVHGGGKLATELANTMKVDVKMVAGRRVTDTATLDIITMVYAGKINKDIVAKLQGLDCDAMGFSGADGNTIVAVKRPVTAIDYGFVGDVTKVNTKTVALLLAHKITPIFCAITHNENGQLLNTNADTIAAELAIAFATKYKVALYYCFEKNGVLKDITNDDSVIQNINTEKYKLLLAQKIIADGMLPKLNNCFYAIQNNVAKVCIGKTTMLTHSKSKFTTIKK